MPDVSGSPETMFQSTPPVRGATPALLRDGRRFPGFNPRPPCGERRRPARDPLPLSSFQSTPPVRGATICDRLPRLRALFQSTPPVRGATGLVGRPGGRRSVSIHAPRAGSDLLPPGGPDLGALFQSTPPVRGATPGRALLGRPRPVSIHAPRAGSDWQERSDGASRSCFNPRPPCGERRHHCNCLWSKVELVCSRERHAPAKATLSLRSLRCRYRLQFSELPRARTPS